VLNMVEHCWTIPLTQVRDKVQATFPIPWKLEGWGLGRDPKDSPRPVILKLWGRLT
jgi:hypothetical protein